MHPILLLLTATVGVNIGWQPAENGGVEYIIQIEPQLVDRLAQGQDLVSEVPPQLDVRRYRITVGTATLPRELPPDRPKAAQIPPAESRPATPEHSASETAKAGPSPKAAAEQPPDDFALLPLDTPTDKRTTNPLTPAAPKKFEADSQSTPLESRPATFNEPLQQQPPVVKTLDAVAVDKPALAADTVSTPKPWLPLTFATLALAVSLGGNVYLGWIAWGERQRFRSLIANIRGR